MAYLTGNNGMRKTRRLLRKPISMALSIFSQRLGQWVASMTYIFVQKTAIQDEEVPSVNEKFMQLNRKLYEVVTEIRREFQS